MDLEEVICESAFDQYFQLSTLLMFWKDPSGRFYHIFTSLHFLITHNEQVCPYFPSPPEPWIPRSTLSLLAEVIGTLT